MSKDLEETIAELGPGYRELVDRLRSAYQSPTELPPSAGHSAHCFSPLAAWLAAASLILAVGLAVVFVRPAETLCNGFTSDHRVVYTVAYATDSASLAAIIATQRADGSWDNDFLTRQNAAALASAVGSLSRLDADSRDVSLTIAYKRALRYLRSRNLAPLTPEELRSRADYAARMVGKL